MFWVVTVLCMGLPACMLFVMALAMFSVGKPGRGLFCLLLAAGLVVLLIWKLNNPDWSLLNRRPLKWNPQTGQGLSPAPRPGADRGQP